MSETTFPVDSYKDAAPHLRRPFTAAAVKFKVQANLGPKDSPTGGLIVAYLDARLAIERLNLICPQLWHDEYQAVGQGQMWCHLTVDGIRRSDVGEGVGKGLVSDALKRAAVKFGIGVSLYATPTMILNVSDGHLKVRSSNKGPTCVLTPNGETRVRGLYASWLSSHGIEAFGEPLSHGDIEGAQGDIEAEEPPAPETEPPKRRLPPSLVSELRQGYVLTGWDVPMLHRQLGQFNVNAVEDLSIEQAQELLSVMSSAVEAREQEPVAQ